MNYILILFSYLVGAIPFGLLFARAVGVDIRKSGSGNIGATNVSRLAGKKLGILTLAADMGKGLLPLILAGRVLAGQPDMELWVLLCGAAAFLGHLFPAYLKFRGGKGVATALGIFLYVQPPAVLASLFVFIGMVRVTGYVSMGSLAAAGLLPAWIWLLGGSRSSIILAFFVGILIWVKHSDNISRLLAGTEKSWKKPEDSPEPQAKS